MSRRERWGVLGGVLAAIDEESRRPDTMRMTNVAARANIAYGRLKEYLKELEARGLLTLSDAPALTLKGREFLREYREWMRLLDRYGLAAPPARAATLRAEEPVGVSG